MHLPQASTQASIISHPATDQEAAAQSPAAPSAATPAPAAQGSRLVSEQSFAASEGVSSQRLAVLEQLVGLGGPDWRDCSYCLEVDGMRAHYLDKGEGQPIVLLHGFGAWAYSWRHNIDALASTYRVIVPDLKGFGLSGRDRRHGHSLDDQARFVLALLDQLGIDRAAWIGNSMGGEISLRAALTAPERITGLGLICSSGTFTVPMVRWLRRAVHMPGFVNWLTRRLVRIEKVRNAVRGALGDPSRYAETDAAAYWLPLSLPGATELVAALARDADFGAIRHRLRDVSVPTLLVWGDRDNFIPLAHGQLLASHIPNSRLVVLPGLGHAPQEEAPAEVNRILLEFLGGL